MGGLRNFLNLLAVAALLAGSILSSVGANAAGLTNVSFENFGEKVDGILRKPEGEGPFPAVVLLHPCGGLRRLVITDWPDYLNGLGYVTLAVDSTGSRFSGKCPNRVRSELVTRALDAYAGLDYLTTLPYVDEKKIAVMGFAFGAATINRGLVSGRAKALGDTDFMAAIALYGHCSGMGSDFYKMPVMEIVGSKDSSVVESCRFLAKKPPELHILPGVYHAFDQSDALILKDDGAGNPMLYDPEATKKAQELTKAFLAKNLGE